MTPETKTNEQALRQVNERLLDALCGKKEVVTRILEDDRPKVKFTQNAKGEWRAGEITLRAETETKEELAALGKSFFNIAMEASARCKEPGIRAAEEFEGVEASKE